jgi:hypothetical protein
MIACIKTLSPASVLASLHALNIVSSIGICILYNSSSLFSQMSNFLGSICSKILLSITIEAYDVFLALSTKKP